MVNRSNRGVLRVKRNGQSRRVRKYVEITGFGPPHDLGVYNNSVDTVKRALMERYLMCKVGDRYEPALAVNPRAYKSNENLQTFKNLLVRKCRGTPVATYDQVIAAYRGPKRRLYLRALDSLYKDAINKRDARLAMFVKHEKLSVLKAPRCINPRSPRYNLELARYLKFLEKKIFKAINSIFGKRTAHTVIKGLNVTQSGKVLRDKWELFSDPVAIGLDATKFDMHVSIPALLYEHSVYNVIFKDRHLAKLLRWQIENRGTARCPDGIIKFIMHGTRSSGDINTSLGNTIIMCALLFAYGKEIGVDFELANNGDDCVVIMERRDEERFTKCVETFFKKYGFRMEVEKPVYEFEQIEFCQSKPVKTSSGWCMVRDIFKCFVKDPMCLVSVQNYKDLQYWMYAVGECGLAITSAVPVMGSWYRMFMRNGLKASAGFIESVFKNTSAFERSKGVSMQSVVTPESRASFYYAFGLTPDDQFVLEDWFDKQSVEPTIMSANSTDEFRIKVWNCHGLQH